MIRCILYLDNSFTFGGAINSIIETIRHLNRSKYKPMLVSAQKSSFLQQKLPSTEYYTFQFKLPWIHNAFFQRITNIPIYDIPFFKKSIIYLRSLYWLFRYTLPESFSICQIGKQCNASLVHLNNILGSQLSGIIAAKLLRVPCVAHLRDYEQSSRTTRRYAQWIEHHIAISESIRQNLLQLGVPDARISVVHDAIDVNAFSEVSDPSPLISEFGIAEDELLIGLFGRVIGWKGTREFVLAVERLSRQWDNFRAFIVGDPSDFDDGYYRQVKELAESLGVADKLVFTGYREDVAQLMHLMDVVVHTSISPEPFGMVIIEAMACGKPVVASNVGGGPLEIVDDGVTGFLVNPKDPDQTASELLTLFSDPDLRKKMGHAGRRKALEQYNSPKQASRIEAIYDMLLEKQ
jgi:glycosyltransferase involved in cell wall biosynthesis